MGLNRKFHDSVVPVRIAVFMRTGCFRETAYGYCLDLQLILNERQVRHEKSQPDHGRDEFDELGEIGAFARV